MLQQHNVSPDAFFVTLELECLKEHYQILKKEIDRFSSFDVATSSGAKKATAKPVLENEMEEQERIYAEKFQVAAEWLEASLGEEDDHLTILKKYFSKISYNDLQETINELYPPAIIATKPQDGEADPNGGEGKVVPLYRASNLRQKMERLWRKQVEGR